MADIKLFKKIDWFFLFGLSVLLVSLFVAIVYASLPNKYECTLYFVGNDESVCDGILVEEHIYKKYYEFRCADGRVLKALTNFRVEKLHK
jgi:hypothetical protein